MEKIDLHEFEYKLHVRNLKTEDFDQLVAMQKISFPGMKVWSRQNIENQIIHFPEGQIVIEIDDRLVASSSSLIIDSGDFNMNMSWDEICDNGDIGTHDPEGDTLYGMEMMVHPDFRGMKLATRLYEARKELCRKLKPATHCCWRTPSRLQSPPQQTEHKPVCRQGYQPRHIRPGS
jgi:GNAT superfamily N-acetyltransferase